MNALKKTNAMDLAIKPRLAATDVKALIPISAVGAVGSAFRVRKTSAGYEPVSGSRRLEVTLAAGVPVSVQDIDTGETFDVELSVLGTIVRA